MKIAITGASGNGKTPLARQLERVADLRYLDVETLRAESADALAVATGAERWVADATLRRIVGDSIVDRADVVVWLDLPAQHPRQPAGSWRSIRPPAVGRGRAGVRSGRAAQGAPVMRV